MRIIYHEIPHHEKMGVKSREKVRLIPLQILPHYETFFLFF